MFCSQYLKSVIYLLRATVRRYVLLPPKLGPVIMQNVRSCCLNFASFAIKHILSKVSKPGWRASSRTISPPSLSVICGFEYGIGAHSDAIANATKQSSLEQREPSSIKKGK